MLTYVAVEGGIESTADVCTPEPVLISWRSEGAGLGEPLGVDEGNPNTGEGVMVTNGLPAFASIVNWQPLGPAQYTAA